MMVCLFLHLNGVMMGINPVGFGVIDIESREEVEKSLEHQMRYQSLGSEEGFGIARSTDHFHAYFASPQEDMSPNLRA